MPRPKKPRGRPRKYYKPEGIPAKPQSIIRSVLRTRPKVERDRIAAEGDKASTTPP